MVENLETGRSRIRTVEPTSIGMGRYPKPIRDSLGRWTGENQPSGACIVACARNEGAYLLEWIAYHRAIGFEEIFLYTNHNNDGSDLLLEALAENGHIVWLDNKTDPTNSPQAQAYRNALTALPDIKSFEWALFIDIDEFFVVDKARFSSVREYLDWQSQLPVDCIAMNWLQFGSFDNIVFDSLPSLERCVLRRHAPDKHIKSMCRPQLFSNSQAHFPIPALGCRVIVRDSDRNLFEPSPEVWAHSLKSYREIGVDKPLLVSVSPRGNGEIQ